jgi:hypothetical protein
LSFTLLKVDRREGRGKVYYAGFIQVGEERKKVCTTCDMNHLTRMDDGFSCLFTFYPGNCYLSVRIN